MAEPVLEQPDHSGDDWTDCPVGEVGQLVQRLQKRQRLQSVRQATSAVAVVALLVVGGYYVKTSVSPARADHGGISCARVKELSQEFVSGELEDKTSEQVKQHLADCESCERFLQELLKESELQPDDAGAIRAREHHLEQGVAHRKRSQLPVIIAAGS